MKPRVLLYFCAGILSAYAAGRVGKRKFIFGFHAVVLAALLVSPREVVGGDDFSVLCTDRIAIERVYYEHRLGTKPPFEQTMPHELVEKLERDDLRKEAVLKNVYGVEITTAMLDAEVSRINSTTRAPEMLAELKSALANDPARFARSVAKPIVVERELRSRFENDATLHQAQFRLAEQARNELLRARTNGASAADIVIRLKKVSGGAARDVTWQLTPADKENTTMPEPGASQRPASASGVYSNEGAVQPAGSRAEHQFHFDDLAPDLQRVLRVQLTKPGDITAVIETPSAFLLFVAISKTPAELSAVSLTVPKQSYEQWLAKQAVPDHSASNR